MDRLHVLGRRVVAEQLHLAQRLITKPLISLFLMLSLPIKFAIYVTQRLFVAGWLYMAGWRFVAWRLKVVGRHVAVRQHDGKQGSVTMLAHA